GGGDGAAVRYVGNEGDHAVRRGAAQGDARVDGLRLLVLWGRRKPPRHRYVPAPPSQPGPFAAPAGGGGTVSPRHGGISEGVITGVSKGAQRRAHVVIFDRQKFAWARAFGALPTPRIK